MVTSRRPIFQCRHNSSKRFFFCFSLIIFHIQRVVYYEFFYYAFKSNWCVISYTISYPIKVIMDRRVFTRAVKVNQSWVIPESGIPYRIQLLLKSTLGVPSLSLPDPTPRWFSCSPLFAPYNLNDLNRLVSDISSKCLNKLYGFLELYVAYRASFDP